MYTFFFNYLVVKFKFFILQGVKYYKNKAGPMINKRHLIKVTAKSSHTSKHPKTNYYRTETLH